MTKRELTHRWVSTIKAHTCMKEINIYFLHTSISDTLSHAKVYFSIKMPCNSSAVSWFRRKFPWYCKGVNNQFQKRGLSMSYWVIYTVLFSVHTCCVYLLRCHSWFLANKCVIIIIPSEKTSLLLRNLRHQNRCDRQPVKANFSFSTVKGLTPANLPANSYATHTWNPSHLSLACDNRKH